MRDTYVGVPHLGRLVAAAGPFAKAAGLLADLAGVQLTAKRVERAADSGLVRCFVHAPQAAS